MKEFLDGLVRQGKETGEVKTMFGRIRPIPELSSNNYMQRQFGERVAMNSPIQGTAADIIKIAMVRVHDRLEREGLSSRLILQVHDELLIEAKKEELAQVEQILSEEMKGAADLAVPWRSTCIPGRPGTTRSEDEAMKFIGITGGVGAGKSAILDFIREHYRAKVVLADDLAKELMEAGDRMPQKASGSLWQRRRVR